MKQWVQDIIRNGYTTPTNTLDHILLSSRDAWKKRAACSQLDPPTADRLFFPDSGPLPAAARQLCAACPVKTECAAAGVGEEFGAWGGVSACTRHLPAA